MAMAKFELRRKAITLRLQGQSYSQIKKQLLISKSTLSRWLKDHPLTAARLKELRAPNESRIEKFRITMQQKRTLRLGEYYKNESLKWLPLTEKELFLAGLFLYWGEGHKANNHSIGITNSDPTLLNFALKWLVTSLKIDKNSIKVYLHLYSDMDIEKERLYWSETLNLPQTQFNKPYIKKSTRGQLDHKGFGHGTCSLVTYGVETKERILMAIKAIAEYDMEYSKAM
jgi:hypothetical protein